MHNIVQTFDMLCNFFVLLNIILLEAERMLLYNYSIISVQNLIDNYTTHKLEKIIHNGIQ